MHVSVIIVSFNSGPLLIECVRSVLASSLPVRIIVSDNGSSDCSVEPLEDLAATERRLVVIRNQANLGFARGNNVAIPFADGEFILFLNPDCLLEASTLERMVAALRANPRAGMAGCRILNPDGSEQAGCRRRLPTPRHALAMGLSPSIWFGLRKHGGILMTDEPLPALPEAVDAISGAFMLVTREALDALGSFDDGYFMHWEDLDYCQRFKLNGREIVFVPGVEVLHFKGRSSHSRPFRVEWHKHAGIARFFRKYYFHSVWHLPLLALVALGVAVRFAGRAIQLMSFAREHETWRDGDIGTRAANTGEVWVFGASSLVGRHLIPRLVAAGYRVRAFSRNPVAHGAADSPHLTWHAYDIGGDLPLPVFGAPEMVVHLAPLWLLPAQIASLANAGMKKLIGFGSTSRFTKSHSHDPEEVRLVARLEQAERSIELECRSLGVRWVVIRPTLIYSLGHDRNVTVLADFIRHFHFFPLLDGGSGLRQPVHADDLARACVALFHAESGWNRPYDLSGGETLSYRQMVERIFDRIGLQPRFVALPRGVWMGLLHLAHLAPTYRRINMEMIDRINADMCFDHGDAARSFGFSPRSFQP
ncbi:MAG: glycosyltransferase [Sulfurisoma sp.]|nr:glycosyltransferase [Sulfurisoma sp.]